MNEALISYLLVWVVKIDILKSVRKICLWQKILEERKKERAFLLPGTRNGRVPFSKIGTQTGTRSIFGKGTRKGTRS